MVGVYIIMPVTSRNFTPQILKEGEHLFSKAKGSWAVLQYYNHGKSMTYVLNLKSHINKTTELNSPGKVTNNNNRPSQI